MISAHVSAIDLNIMMGGSIGENNEECQGTSWIGAGVPVWETNSFDRVYVCC